VVWPVPVNPRDGVIIGGMCLIKGSYNELILVPLLGAGFRVVDDDVLTPVKLYWVILHRFQGNASNSGWAL